MRVVYIYIYIAIVLIEFWSYIVLFICLRDATEGCQSSVLFYSQARL